MENSFWRITVTAGGATTSLLGTEDVMRSAVLEWREWFEGVASDDKAVLSVEGFYDSADRAECSFVIPMSRIEMMLLLEM